MITHGLPILIGCLSSSAASGEVRVALGRLLAGLAGYFEIAVLILDHCMESVMELWTQDAAMQVRIQGVRWM